MKEGRRSFLKMLGIGAAVAPAAAAGIAFSANDAQADFAKKLPAAFKDPFYIPADKIPKGMIYNWKRVFVDRKTPDFENFVTMTKNGWQPVPYARHPDLYPAVDCNNTAHWVERGGLVLMEKPIT